jgi:hypothetical protein
MVTYNIITLRCCGVLLRADAMESGHLLYELLALQGLESYSIITLKFCAILLCAVDQNQRFCL